MHLLLVEDNPDLVANVVDFFGQHGHAVDIAYDGLTGLKFALDNGYDVVVLDLMLPGMDGLEVCRRLRDAGRDVPVLMLTARDALDDKLEGFDSGADDYLVKPFALPELEARLAALRRRARGGMARRRLRVADLTLDTATLQVERSGRRIELPPIPLRILELLLRQSPRVVPRDMIVREIWGDSPPDSDALRAHMHALRSAIERDAGRPILHTVRGIGYQLVDPGGE